MYPISTSPWKHIGLVFCMCLLFILCATQFPLFTFVYWILGDGRSHLYTLQEAEERMKKLFPNFIIWAGFVQRWKKRQTLQTRLCYFSQLVLIFRPGARKTMREECYTHCIISTRALLVHYVVFFGANIFGPFLFLCSFKSLFPSLPALVVLFFYLLLGHCLAVGCPPLNVQKRGAFRFWHFRWSAIITSSPKRTLSHILIIIVAIFIKMLTMIIVELQHHYHS